MARLQGMLPPLQIPSLMSHTSMHTVFLEILPLRFGHAELSKRTLTGCASEVTRDSTRTGTQNKQALSSFIFMPIIIEGRDAQ